MHPQPLWQHPDFPAFYWNEAIITETRHILALTAARTHLAAQSHTLHPRQLKVLHKLIDAELQGGFAGGLSNANYQSITQTSDRTALRDLKDLVERGFLTKTGVRKGTRYWIASCPPC